MSYKSELQDNNEILRLILGMIDSLPSKTENSKNK
jgi:hypothetical protein